MIVLRGPLYYCTVNLISLNRFSLHSFMTAFASTLSCASGDGNKSTSFKLTTYRQLLGYDERKNDVIYIHPDTECVTTGLVVYFHGDSQDYRDTMLAHRDNHRHVSRCLESTVELLSQKFPFRDIVAIKAKEMKYGIFATFANFVPSDSVGSPTFQADYGAISHLRLLLGSLYNEVNSKDKSACCDEMNEGTAASDALLSKSFQEISLVGFSKGCTVLNQFLHELDSSMAVPQNESFLKRVEAIYWLDGGHAGGKNTWITNSALLQTFAKRMGHVEVHIHVTPYEIRDPNRPWIGKEERRFSDTLRRCGMNVQRVEHFMDEPPSLQNHFRVLDVFRQDVVS